MGNKTLLPAIYVYQGEVITCDLPLCMPGMQWDTRLGETQAHILSIQKIMKIRGKCQGVSITAHRVGMVVITEKSEAGIIGRSLAICVREKPVPNKQTTPENELSFQDLTEFKTKIAA